MSTTDQTFDELLDSLTGYDEMAIKSVAKVPMSHLLETDPILGSRHAIAIHQMRQSGQEGPKSYAAHYKAAMDLPLKDVRTYFAEEPEDVDPTDPDSESGKGD
jgi:hypothetical protein